MWISARLKRPTSLLAILLFAIISLLYLRHPYTPPPPPPAPQPGPSISEVAPALDPLEALDTRSHPVDQLIRHGEAQFEQALAKQSKNLAEAVKEYRRRYKIPPPPNFDEWFDFAQRKGVVLIDEYDTIYHNLLPFWALPPQILRSRVREAIGFGANFLTGLQIRNGEVANIAGGPDWLKEALTGMTKDFLAYLPDMDLPFNMHDEPRVVVPSEELSKLVAQAKDVDMPEAYTNERPKNAFSPRPKDVNDGKRIDEVKVTKFNVYAHQPTWTPSKLSCPLDSPARKDLDELQKDNITAYALGDLGFIYNHTAFSDICLTPSLRETYGFFDRPNAFNIIHDLFPVFSQSKVSSFQDILYPSPWYWYGKVSYNEKKDMEWRLKEDRLWWRGSTTGGFSRSGGWRRQHRQQLVSRINAGNQAKILVDQGTEKEPNWQPREVSRSDYKEIIDVNFSHIGQCDPEDCEAQKAFFDPATEVDQQDAWKYKYLLDMDGNAFSGRFYAFLRSHSLVYKMSIFQEWHSEWVKPWVHYIPLSLKGGEWLEIVRYFSGEPEGKLQAPRMAEQGRMWAEKALRNEDFEVYFFRLLLEYGRLVDDNRATIGYAA
ncbi:glycosyltransferase family 90 protein [Viridothelium virens]|uniref:Glycosyltransferase family 90 protein n=1 Tax=Viridothelium virens TaxID=1048519 RepID=A0A6A6GZD4_VIRVR|nr:glycosyltransferase family 90 protein [Viridothelium virens]